jgi:hypothetical protein
MNAAGVAMAVWQLHDGATYSVCGNRFTYADGWGDAAAVVCGGTDAHTPQVSTDPNGNTITVYQDGGFPYNLYANRYDTLTGWGTPASLESGGGNAYYQHITTDIDGNGYAVWIQVDGDGHKSVFVGHYAALTDTWGTEERIEGADGEAMQPQVTTDATGNVFYIWTQSDGSHMNIYVREYYGDGHGWSPILPLENINGHAYTPQVATDRNGNAIAVWTQSDNDGHSTIFANRYINGTGWQTEGTPIEDATGDAFNPQIAFDADGNALAVWKQWRNSRYYIYANRFSSTTGRWEAAIQISGETGLSAEDPQIAIDSDGNALAVWREFDGSYWNIYANRYDHTSGWSNAGAIEHATGHAKAPQISMDGSGRALAVWYQHDGTRNRIYASRFY